MVEDMSLMELQQEVLGLPLEEQNILHAALVKSMEEKSHSYRVNLCNEKGSRYVNAMNNLIGRNILEPKRDSVLVWGRNFVVWQLTQDGFTEHQIGKIMNMDHSTINHMKGRVKNVMEFPAFYKQEIKMWTDFQLAIL